MILPWFLLVFHQSLAGPSRSYPYENEIEVDECTEQIGGKCRFYSSSRVCSVDCASVELSLWDENTFEIRLIDRPAPGVTRPLSAVKLRYASFGSSVTYAHDRKEYVAVCSPAEGRMFFWDNDSGDSEVEPTSADGRARISRVDIAYYEKESSCTFLMKFDENVSQKVISLFVSKGKVTDDGDSILQPGLPLDRTDFIVPIPMEDSNIDYIEAVGSIDPSDYTMSDFAPLVKSGRNVAALKSESGSTSSSPEPDAVNNSTTTAPSAVESEKAKGSKENDKEEVTESTSTASTATASEKDGKGKAKDVDDKEPARVLPVNNDDDTESSKSSSTTAPTTTISTLPPLSATSTSPDEMTASSRRPDPRQSETSIQREQFNEKTNQSSEDTTEANTSSSLASRTTTTMEATKSTESRRTFTTTTVASTAKEIETEKDSTKPKEEEKTTNKPKESNTRSGIMNRAMDYDEEDTKGNEKEKPEKPHKGRGSTSKPTKPPSTSSSTPKSSDSEEKFVDSPDSTIFLSSTTFVAPVILLLLW